MQGCSCLYLCHAVDRRQRILSRANIVRLRLCTRKCCHEHTRENLAKLPVSDSSDLHVYISCVDFTFLYFDTVN